MKLSYKLIRNTLVFLSILVSLIILMLPAILNKYPLLFSDTGTYIYSGFARFIPKDRPIFYGLFLCYISMAESLWLVVIAQAVLSYYVVYTFIDSFVPRSAHIYTAIIIVCLYLTTGISEYVCQIMPDIFAGLSLIIFLIAFQKKFTITETFLLGLILIFSGTFHYSHILVNTGFMVFYMIYFLFFRKKKNLPGRNVISISVMILITWLIIPVVNKGFSDSSSMAKYKSVLLSGRLIECGIMSTYLEENCNDNKYVFCDDIEQIKQIKTSSAFVWQIGSPLYEDCSMNNTEECWKQMTPRLDTILLDMIQKRSYQKLILFEVFKSSWKQIITVNLKTFPPMLEGSSVHYPISGYLKKDYQRYKNARQAKTTITFITKNKVIKLFYLISAIGILTILILRRKTTQSFQNISLFTALIVFSVFNTTICANLSCVVGRYQGRIEWAFMLVFLCLLSQIIFQQLNKERTN